MGKLIVYKGPMFSGKTSRLLLELEKDKHAGRHVVALKPQIDTRYDLDTVISHDGLKCAAVPVDNPEQIYAAVETTLDKCGDSSKIVIGFDELFMLKGASDALIYLFRNGITVKVATLDLSYDCKPFGEVQKLLPWATEIVMCTSACSVCGQDAFYTWRKASSDEDVLIGGSELYEPRCGEHHSFLRNSF